MKKLSSWYAFMRFKESGYSNMGFLDAQDVLTLVNIMNPFSSQIQLSQLLPSQLNHAQQTEQCCNVFFRCDWCVDTGNRLKSRHEQTKRIWIPPARAGRSGPAHAAQCGNAHSCRLPDPWGWRCVIL